MAAQPDRYGSSSEEGDSGSVSGPSTPGSASAPEDSATSGLGEEGAEESSEEGAADPSLVAAQEVEAIVSYGEMHVDSLITPHQE